MKGTFVVLDGLDGIGKSVYLEAMAAAARAAGWTVFDVHEFWQRTGRHPTLEELGGAQLLLTSEPTYVGVGKRIREELIRAGTNHSAKEIAQAYAEDRRALYEEFLLPALERGVNVIQSRGVTTSLVYQPLDAVRKGESLSWEDVESLPGNAFCLAREHLMEAIVIPTVNDVQEVIRRLGAREKQDDATFETYEFQLKVKEGFASKRFKEYFKQRGVKVLYADAETSVEHSRSEGERFFRTLFSTRKHSTPSS